MAGPRDFPRRSISASGTSTKPSSPSCIANSQAAGTAWSGYYDPTPDDRTNFDNVCFNCPGPSLPPPTPWPGSFTLPFVVVLGADNAILVGLWAGTFLSEDRNEADFLDTAALSITPPPASR